MLTRFFRFSTALSLRVGEARIVRVEIVQVIAVDIGLGVGGLGADVARENALLHTALGRKGRMKLLGSCFMFGNIVF